MSQVLSRAAIASTVAIVLSFTPVFAQEDDITAPPGGKVSRPPVTTEEDNMDWGWIGLAGLLGLAGLMRKDRHDHVDRTTHR